MNIKLVDNSIYELSDLTIEKGVLYLYFKDKTVDEVKTILSASANLNTITLLEDTTQEPLAYYYNYTVFAGIYISPDNIVRGMLNQQLDETLSRISTLEASTIEAKTIANDAKIQVANLSTQTQDISTLIEETAPSTMLSASVASIAAQSFSDEDAIKVKDIYPKYSDCIGRTVNEGFKLSHNSILYRVRQASLEISATYEPGSTGTESLYEVIDEQHSGTQEDPIPYFGNMKLEKDKYYIQYDILYKCINGTGQAVYHPLSQLVGNYVEVVSND